MACSSGELHVICFYWLMSCPFYGFIVTWLGLLLQHSEGQYDLVMTPAHSVLALMRNISFPDVLGSSP